MRRLKILLIEDSLTESRIIEDVLKRSGMKVQVVSSLDSGLNKIKANPDYDYIIIDLEQSKKECIEAYHSIQDTHPTSKIIVLTGLKDQEIEEEVQKHGSEFLFKDKNIPLKLGFRILQHQVKEETEMVKRWRKQRNGK